MNFLTQIPAKYRKIIYGVGSLALAVYAIWEGVGHEWRAFVIALVTAIVTTLATANTDTSGNSVTVSDASVAHVVTPDTEAHFQL